MDMDLNQHPSDRLLRLIILAWYLVELLIVVGFAVAVIVSMIRGAGAWTAGSGMVVVLGYVGLVLGRRSRR